MDHFLHSGQSFKHADKVNTLIERDKCPVKVQQKISSEKVTEGAYKCTGFLKSKLDKAMNSINYIYTLIAHF
jgi:hypothetical protein